jgi:hypothetical protein
VRLATNDAVTAYTPVIASSRAIAAIVVNTAVCPVRLDQESRARCSMLCTSKSASRRIRPLNRLGDLAA